LFLRENIIPDSETLPVYRFGAPIMEDQGV
jgi:hypothetical protein